MSATNRGAVRLPQDSYITPAWCVKRLLEKKVFASCGPRWLDPCAGDGAIIKATMAVDPSPIWGAVEIRKAMRRKLEPLVHADYLLIGDFLRSGLRPGYDVVLTNPPYSLAFEFIQKSMEIATMSAFLLRVNFLASIKRHSFLSTHVPDVYILSNRPSFTNEGTDATEYAWMVFHQDERTQGKVEILDLTPKKDRSA